jgi:hypothetical protein
MTVGVVAVLIGAVALVGVELASVVVIWAGAVAAWVFVAMYHLLSRGAWARDPIGRHVMAFVAVDAAVFTLLALTTLWPLLGLMTWYRWAYVASVAGIPYTIIWRIVIAWRLFHDIVPVAGRRPEETVPVPTPGVTPVRPPPRPRTRLGQPAITAVVGLAAGQVTVVDLVGGALGHHVALLVGVVQVGLGCFAYGRAGRTSPAASP